MNPPIEYYINFALTVQVVVLLYKQYLKKNKEEELKQALQEYERNQI